MVLNDMRPDRAGRVNGAPDMLRAALPTRRHPVLFTPTPGPVLHVQPADRFGAATKRSTRYGGKGGEPVLLVLKMSRPPVLQSRK
jgi:hypothetical protein